MHRCSPPLLFLLSFAAIFLYSYHYHSSLHHLPQPQSQQSPLLRPQNPRNPNPNPNPNPNFTFTIKLLAFDRLPSLRRCLLSLATADYSGDRADLHVFVDHFRNSSGSSVDKDLENSHRILEFLDGFRWSHGEKLVHYRTGNAGLQAQWLEAWWPSSDDEFAFVVEDDLEVSPLYYRFLKGLILKYYYDPGNYSPDIYGASLQRPRFVAGKHGNKLQVDSETRLFLYQMVGTWGQLLFPKPWKEFRLWYDLHKAKGIKPILQGMVTTGWYKKIGEKIWTPWFIKFIHSRGYYNIYTNFLQERALSISHRDAGVNYGKTAGPDSKLLDESSLDFNLWKLQALRYLKWYDFCFSEVLPWRVVRSYNELGSILGSLQKQQTIVLVSLYKTTERIARNLICHLDRLSIQNFILIGGKTDLLHDLARRGYPVIDSNQFIDSTYKSTGKQLETDLMKEIWVKANVIKRSLELGCDCWVMDGNMVPSTDFFTELPDSSYTFSAAKTLELMFVRSSPTSLKIWVEDFVSKVAATGLSLMVGNSLPVEHRHFVYFATKVLEDTGTTKVQKFDDLIIGVKIGDDTINQKSPESRKFVFWSGEMTVDSVQRDLKKLDMWLIDGDFSCVSVVCHH